jgi:hypothetical protein
MAREAKLFNATSGSPTRGFRRLTGNLPPSWIDRAAEARKAREPELLKALRQVQGLRRRRPNARATIRAAEKELNAILREWETAYRKECFYYGIRALLELDRKGATRL